MKGVISAAVACLIASGCVTITFVGEPPIAVDQSPTLQAVLATPSASTSTIPSATPAADESPAPLSTSTPRVTPTPVPSPSKPAMGDCADDAYTLAGYHWMQSMGWMFREFSTPDEYDTTEVLDVLKLSFENITSARNDCGRADNVNATSLYQGVTRLEPCKAEFGDSWNVIGFGPMTPDHPDAIAYMCPYAYDNGRLFEVDIVINENVPWALSVADCNGFEEMLEATVTHEIGHAFGLGHVAERRHGDLTMSTRSNGPCHNEESTLGLGDLLALEELYPPD